MTQGSGRPLWPAMGAGALALLLVVVFGRHGDQERASTPAAAVAAAAPAATLRPERVALAFEPVPGAEGAFLARGLGADLRVAADGATFRPGEHAIRMHVVGGDAAAGAVPLEPQAGRANYFTGNDPAAWRTGVVRHGRLRYEAVYPGVALEYYGNARDLEYDFVVAPGADPAPIAVSFTGVEGMRLDEAGNLVLATPDGDLLQRRPVVYQWVGGERRLVEAAYSLRDGLVRFVLGEYDRALALVIDPVITYSTFLGGSWAETGVDVAVDPQGYFYATGHTSSIDFPVVSAPQPTPGGEGNDIFVAKYAPDGQVVYATYLASGSMEKVQAIAVDAAGRAYVTGFTDGPDFPVANPIQAGPLSPGGRAVFVTRIAAEGDVLEFSTYLGGSADYGEGIAVDDAGHAYVTGSATYGFPTTPGVVFPNTQWGDDMFVARLDTNAGELLYATYIDGTDTTSSGYAIDVDAAGNAYVTGHVRGKHFPVVGGFQQQPASFDGDAFLLKLNPTASAILYSTYFGGSDYDFASGLDIDAKGNAYIAGVTESLDLPAPGGFQPTHGGGRHDAFVAKIDTIGGGLVYASYLGGSKAEGYHDIDVAVDRGGAAHVAGSTFSSDFPVVDAVQPQIGGSRSGFLVKVAPDGGSLAFGTYVGAGTYSQTQVNAVAVDRLGNAYITGVTDGDDFPVVDAAQPELNDSYMDAFVMRIAIGEPERRTGRDFDGDGRDDVMWRHAGTGADAIWLGANAATQQRMARVANPDWRIVANGDFGGDGDADVFWRNAADGKNVIWHGADNRAQERVTRITNLGWQVVGAGDLDGDGADDVVWRDATNGATAVWYSGSYALRASLRRVTNLDWRIVGIGDFDGDGRDDLLWRNVETGAGTWWPAGDGGQAQRMTRITNLAWDIVGVGDYDGDGRDDVFWRNGATGANGIWRSANYATQQPAARVGNLAWRVEASGDYDGDGVDDVFWRHGSTGANTVWLAADSTTTQATRRVSDTLWQVVP